MITYMRAFFLVFRKLVFLLCMGEKKTVVAFKSFYDKELGV